MQPGQRAPHEWSLIPFDEKKTTFSLLLDEGTNGAVLGTYTQPPHKTKPNFANIVHYRMLHLFRTLPLLLSSTVKGRNICNGEILKGLSTPPGEQWFKDPPKTHLLTFAVITSRSAGFRFCRGCFFFQCSFIPAHNWQRPAVIGAVVNEITDFPNARVLSTFHQEHEGLVSSPSRALRPNLVSEASQFRSSPFSK